MRLSFRNTDPASDGLETSEEPALSPAATEWLSLAAQARCNVCGEAGCIEIERADDPFSLRESLACRSCGAISRDRALVLVLSGLLGERSPLANWTPRKRLRVLETSGYRGHPRFLAELFDYYNLPYAPPPEGESGAAIDARRGADLQDLQFPAEFFDAVITAEVLEHVPDERRAIAEIARVLARGGHLVLETPYWHGLERTEVRVHRWHGRDVYLYPPEYHAEDALVYRIYGRDLLAQLAAAGLAVGYLELDVPQLAITPQPVIVATKASYLDLAGFRLSSWLHEPSV